MLFSLWGCRAIVDRQLEEQYICLPYWTHRPLKIVIQSFKKLYVSFNYIWKSWPLLSDSYLTCHPFQIHLYNLYDGSLASSMDITYTEIIGKGHLTHGRLAMRVMNVCSRDVVVIDLVARKVVFSSKTEFHVDGHGSIIRLRENQFVMAVENNLYSLKY